MIVSVIYFKTQIFMIINFVLNHSHFLINKLKTEVSCLLFIHHMIIILLSHQQLSDSDRININNKHIWNSCYFNFNIIFSENSKLISLSISKSENFSRTIIYKINFNKVILQFSKLNFHLSHLDDILTCFQLNNICLLS